MVTYCILAFIVLYKGEPYDECGVGNDASGFNCIKNSTSAMSKALQKYGQQANKKIVYYIDHVYPNQVCRAGAPTKKRFC